MFIKFDKMEKIAKWLNEHFRCIGDSIKANVVHLWCIVISFALMTMFGAMGWNGKGFEILCMVLYLVASVVPPLAAGVVALFKHEKWNPWYWFPVIAGNVIGGLLAIAVGLVFGWCTMF